MMHDAVTILFDSSLSRCVFLVNTLTRLHTASSLEALEVVRLLLENSADINAEDDRGAKWNLLAAFIRDKY